MLHFFDVFAPSLVPRQCPGCPSFGLHKFLFLCSQVSLIVTESQCLSLSCSSSVNERVFFKDHRGFNCVVTFCCQTSTCWVVQCLSWLCCFLLLHFATLAERCLRCASWCGRRRGPSCLLHESLFVCQRYLPRVSLLMRVVASFT